MKDGSRSAWETFTEELEVAGSQLVNEINRLVAEGNVRRIEIRSEQGDVFLSIPLTAGAVAGGVVVLAAPWLALIAAVAGVAARVRLAIVRTVPPPADEDSGPATREPDPPAPPAP